MEPLDVRALPYVEDHLFYIEHWFHSIFWNKVRQVGKILQKEGFIEDVEDILDDIKQALDKISTFMGGRAAEKLAIGSITSGAANDIIQATKLARAMVTRFGMSEEFDMMALEMVNNPYLGGDTSLLVSAETASRIDAEVLKIIKTILKRL